MRNIGTYNVFTPSPNDSTGQITYECNGGAKNVVVAMCAGQSGVFMPRAMGGGTDNLQYNLYKDAARARVAKGPPGI